MECPPPFFYLNQIFLDKVMSKLPKETKAYSRLETNQFQGSHNRPLNIIANESYDRMLTADRENKARILSMRWLTRIGAYRWIPWRGTYNNDD